ncbi:MAG: hypothetical protein ABFS16_00240 [Bacteroidota bacterium]
MPDPLKTFKGKKIKNTKKWNKKGRPELLDLLTQNVYGEVSGKLNFSFFDVLEKSDGACGGKARRKQVELNFE